MVSKPDSVEPIDPGNPIVVEYEQRQRDLQELAACKADMAAAIGRQIDWLLEMEAGGMLRNAETMAAEPFGPAEASAQARAPLNHEPGTNPQTGHFVPDRVGWNDLARMIEHDPTAGRDLWFGIKREARDELAGGVRGGKALESPMPSTNQPWERARYLAIVDALRTDLQPRGALEHLLIERMASTYHLCLHWQQEAVEREALEVWQGDSTIRQEHAGMTAAQKERQRLEYGYLPPRQTQAQAIEAAYLMSERFERAFLRLIREFRNQRRVFANLIVAADTVNLANGGPQQVNMAGKDRA